MAFNSQLKAWAVDRAIETKKAGADDRTVIEIAEAYIEFVDVDGEQETQGDE